MATLKAPARLPELVKAAFAKALYEGDLSYFPTHVQDVRVGSLSVRSTTTTQLKTCRQLSVLTRRKTVSIAVLAISRKQAQDGGASQATRHYHKGPG